MRVKIPRPLSHQLSNDLLHYFPRLNDFFDRILNVSLLHLTNIRIYAEGKTLTQNC